MPLIKTMAAPTVKINMADVPRSPAINDPEMTPNEKQA